MKGGSCKAETADKLLKYFGQTIRKKQSGDMNRKQIICVLVGGFILAGMIFCPPITIGMMSLYFYAGDPNAGMNLITFHRFMPKGWPGSINYGFLFWECFFLFVILFCIIYAFRRCVRKPAYDINKWNKMFSFMLLSASILSFILWFVETSFVNLYTYFNLGLLVAGLLGLLGAFVIVNVYVAKKQSIQILEVVLSSCTILVVCMLSSHWGHRYSPNESPTSPNMWRLLGVAAFLGIWVFYLIVQFIKKKYCKAVL